MIACERKKKKKSKDKEKSKHLGKNLQNMRQGTTPEELKFELIVTFPKKGDLCKCDFGEALHYFQLVTKCSAGFY
jgi:hypothetical protein